MRQSEIREGQGELPGKKQIQAPSPLEIEQGKFKAPLASVIISTLSALSLHW
jgi:hypothetical protein